MIFVIHVFLNTASSTTLKLICQPKIKQTYSLVLLNTNRNNSTRLHNTRNPHKRNYIISIYSQNCPRSLFPLSKGSAKDSVPVAEEGGVVAARPLVVHVVSRCTAQQTERHQVVEGPRQVVTYVVLH